MPFAESATLFSRCRESGPPPGAPEVPGPAEYGPCLQILKAMNQIMAEHFGIPPGPEKERTRGRREETGTENGRSFCHRVPASCENFAVPPPKAAANLAGGPTASEGSRRYE